MKRLIVRIFFLLFFTATTALAAVPQAQKTVILQTQSAWNGVKIEPLHIANPEVTVAKVTIPSGAILPMHKHVMLNAAYLIKGSLLVETQSGQTITLKAGDAINETVNTWHFGKNIGDDDVEIIVFYVGEKGAPLATAKD